MTTRSHPIRGLILKHASDTGVFARACGGDPIAFSEVYRRFRSRVYAFCLARLLSRDAAEDATQETFLRVLRVTEPVRNPQAWLFSVAKNVCFDIERARLREAPCAGESEGELCPGVADDAADEALGARQARVVLLALRRIRPRYRTVLILREVHAVPVSEIAESLGIREATTHTLVSRARRAFARAYADVSGLSESCADAVMLMFKRATYPLGAEERDRLESHVRECERCRVEEKRVSRQMIAALAPMLVARAAMSESIIAKALFTTRPPLAGAGSNLQEAAQFGTPLVLALALLLAPGAVVPDRMPPVSSGASGAAAAGAWPVPPAERPAPRQRLRHIWAPPHLRSWAAAGTGGADAEAVPTAGTAGSGVSGPSSQAREADGSPRSAKELRGKPKGAASPGSVGSSAAKPKANAPKAAKSKAKPGAKAKSSKKPSARGRGSRRRIPRR